MKKRHTPVFVQSKEFATTEDYFESYLDECMNEERQKMLSKEAEEQRLKDEEDLLDAEIDEHLSTEERSISPPKPKTFNKFHRMVSYRHEDVFEKEVKDIYSGSDSSESSSDPPKIDKIPYLMLVDPELRVFYRFNMHTYEKTYQVIEDKSLDKHLTAKLTKTLKTIK